MLKTCLVLLTLALAAPALAEQMTMTIDVNVGEVADASYSSVLNAQLQRGWQVTHAVISGYLVILTLERSDLFADPKADPLTVEQIRARARASIEARRARGEEVPERLVPDPSTY